MSSLLYAQKKDFGLKKKKKKDTRANTGCFQTPFQGSWGPPKANMPQNLPQGVDHLIFFPPLPLQYSTQEAPDLDSTKSASHKTQVVSLSFYPSSKKKKKNSKNPTTDTQPQAYSCKHLVNRKPSEDRDNSNIYRCLSIAMSRRLHCHRKGWGGNKLFFNKT